MSGRSQQQKRKPCRLTGKRSWICLQSKSWHSVCLLATSLAFRSGCLLVCSVFMVCCGFAWGLQWHLTRFAVLTRLVLSNVGLMPDVFGLVRAGCFGFFGVFFLHRLWYRTRFLFVWSISQHCRLYLIVCEPTSGAPSWRGSSLWRLLLSGLLPQKR